MKKLILILALLLASCTYHGKVHNDRVITKDVYAAIFKENKFSIWGREVSVSTTDGIVTLKGMVPNDTVKQTIIQKTSAVTGVRGVTDQIKVRGRK